MKVLIYTQYWKKGGIERLVNYLAYYLPRRGSFELCILTEDVPTPGEQYNLGTSTRIYCRSFTPFNFQNQKKMKGFVEWLNPDVVVAMGSNRSLTRMPIALVDTSYPLILSEHNSRDELLRKFHQDTRFLNSVRYLADINHVIFNDFAVDFDRKSSVRAIANPIIDSQLRADVGGASTKTIVHIGRFQIHQKQQDVLIRSFALICNEFPDWNLELYGGDWFGGRSKVQALISELGVADRVVLKGETDLVEEALASAQILAFPSAYEGFGLVVGEALAVGLPVVAYSRCSGVNKLIRHNENGVLVSGDTRNHEAFANGLRLCMESATLRERLSRGALNSVADYSLEKFLAGWESMLRDASGLRGKNRLAKLSLMEQNYVDLVCSGKLFDEKNANNRRLRRLNRIKRLLNDFYVWPIIRIVYNVLFKKSDASAKVKRL